MQKKIIVNKIQIKEGVKKDGTKWTKRTYWAEDGFYNSFLNQNVEQGITLGTMMEVECEPDKKYKKNYQISNIISIGKENASGEDSSSNPDHPNHITPQKFNANPDKRIMTSKHEERGSNGIQREWPEPLSDLQIEEIFDQALVKFVEDPDLAGYFVGAKLQQQSQRFGLELTKQIEKQKAENIRKVKEGK